MCLIEARVRNEELKRRLEVHRLIPRAFLLGATFHSYLPPAHHLSYLAGLLYWLFGCLLVVTKDLSFVLSLSTYLISAASIPFRGICVC